MILVSLSKDQVDELLNSNVSEDTKECIKKKLLKDEKKRNKRQLRKQEKQSSIPSLARRAEAERFRNDLIRHQTESEKVFKAILKSLKIEYDFQKIFFINSRSFYIADFYIPCKNIIFEIDGGYHFNKEQGMRDAKRTKILKYRGIDAVHRFSNKNVLDNNIYTSERIKKLINK